MRSGTLRAREAVGLLAAFATFATGSAEGATATFREGVAAYAGTQDTYVDPAAPNTSFGGSASVRVDNNGPVQGLVRFENIFGTGPGQIPLGATILSASLTVEVTSLSATPANIGLYRILVPWSESDTWNSLGAGLSRDDVEAASVADAFVPDPNSSGPQTIPGLEASVQAWALGAANRGWVIITDQNNAWVFRSSEDGTPVLRPLLTVDYVATAWFQGRVFEDADFAGVASGWDGGVGDAPLANVDVELYTFADAYVASTTTDASGSFVFWGVADGDYKLRVRSGTIGDSNTLPAGGLNAACGITDPASGAGCVLPELAWARGAALYGGQDATVDDTATADDSGPGDTWIPVTAAGAGVPGIDFGFAYNLIVNTEDAGQGSLRQFLANADAIGTGAATTASSSQVRMQVPANRSSGADSWWRVTVASALPTLTDDGTTLDASTQRTNSGVDSNSRGPELEIHGNGLAAAGLQLIGSSDHVIREIAINGFTGDGVAIGGAGADRNAVHGCYVGTDAVGEAAVANANGITIFGGADAVIGSAAAADRNLVAGNVGEGIRVAGPSRRVTIRGNSIGVGRTGSETALGNGGDGVFVASSDDPSTVLIGGLGAGEGNVVARNGGDGVDSQASGTADEIAGNVIRHNAGRGVVANTAGARVVGNVVWSNGGASSPGIRIDANGCFVVHNTVHGSGSDGIVVDASGASIHNNLFTGNGGYGMRIVSGSPTESDNGVPGPTTNPANALGRSNVALDASDLDVDPEYGNAAGGDFGLTECTSPAINTGVDLGAAQPDVNGAAPGAFDGPAPDMGALESSCPAQPLVLVKRGFLTDGTPVADGATLPRGTLVDFLLYLNNPGPARPDASVRDVLDPSFVYLAGTTRIDTTTANCAGGNCTGAEEAAIYSAVDAVPASTDAVDGDLASFDGPTTTIDAGDENAGNAQLDVPANSVAAMLIRVRVQ